MDARKQLMISRMTDVVVNGVKAGLVKTRQVAPLLDGIEQYYSGSLENKRLHPSVHISIGDALSLLAQPVPGEAVGAYALAVGDMVAQKLGNADHILDAIEKLAKALVSVREPLQLRADNFRFVTSAGGISYAESMFGVGSPLHKRLCAAMATVLELQNMIDKTTVELYLKARTLKAGSVSDIRMYFDKTVTDKGLAAELDVATYEHLIRCALKLGPIPSAEYMTYKLVDVEGKR